MRIRIYTMTHKKFEVPEDPLYQPLHVGHAVGEDLGYPGDDTGENISAQNCYYSELTGLYWIWKNCHDVEYVGTCHYRRYLINEAEQIYTKTEYEMLLQKYDLITTRRVKLNHSYYFGFSANHNIKALDMTGEVIKELYPAYYDTFVRLVNGTETYFGNIMVTSKKLFDEYAEWLFSIFFVVAQRIELETGEDAYHKRVFGFISEFLLLVWTKVRGLSVCECKVGMIGEKAETHEMKEQLAEYFNRRDVDGAKAYFLQRKAERPDVLMEASDVTGELRLCMQIIATAGKEREEYGDCILDRENRFARLMQIFEGINRCVYRYRNQKETADDVLFLKRYAVSEVALRIALMIPGDNEKVQKQLLLHIKDDLKKAEESLK